MSKEMEASNSINDILAEFDQTDIDEVVQNLDPKIVVALEDAAAWRMLGSIMGGGGVRVDCELENQGCIVDINRVHTCQTCSKRYCRKHKLVSCPEPGCGGSLV